MTRSLKIGNAWWPWLREPGGDARPAVSDGTGAWLRLALSLLHKECEAKGAPFAGTLTAHVVSFGDPAVIELQLEPMRAAVA